MRPDVEINMNNAMKIQSLKNKAIAKAGYWMVALVRADDCAKEWNKKRKNNTSDLLKVKANEQACLRARDAASCQYHSWYRAVNALYSADKILGEANDGEAKAKTAQLEAVVPD